MHRKNRIVVVFLLGMFAVLLGSCDQRPLSVRHAADARKVAAKLLNLRYLKCGDAYLYGGRLFTNVEFTYEPEPLTEDDLSNGVETRGWARVRLTSADGLSGVDGWRLQKAKGNWFVEQVTADRREHYVDVDDVKPEAHHYYGCPQL